MSALEALTNRGHGIVVRARVMRGHNGSRGGIEQDRLGGCRARIHAQDHGTVGRPLHGWGGHHLHLVLESIKRRKRIEDRRKGKVRGFVEGILASEQCAAPRFEPLALRQHDKL